MGRKTETFASHPSPTLRASSEHAHLTPKGTTMKRRLTTLALTAAMLLLAAAPAFAGGGNAGL